MATELNTYKGNSTDDGLEWMLTEGSMSLSYRTLFVFLNQFGCAEAGEVQPQELLVSNTDQDDLPIAHLHSELHWIGLLSQLDPYLLMNSVWAHMS